ncbi:hypothetical protein, partial [Streptomyces filamentosus]|uniref:hypothetical protein n=1 Tax=Streptomyces filamentosus TaxID=67294 RepID=UPI0033323DFC
GAGAGGSSGAGVPGAGEGGAGVGAGVTGAGRGAGVVAGGRRGEGGGGTTGTGPGGITGGLGSGGGVGFAGGFGVGFVGFVVFVGSGFWGSVGRGFVGVGFGGGVHASGPMTATEVCEPPGPTVAWAQESAVAGVGAVSSHTSPVAANDRVKGDRNRDTPTSLNTWTANRGPNALGFPGWWGSSGART